ncbi:TPA: fimbrial assembly protein [Yersinia enterocolitica]
MKKQLTGFAVLALGIAAAHAAPPTTELKVKGKIGVPTCNINAPDSGVYDTGNISSTQIKSGTATTELPKITKNWTVSCDSETFLTVNSTDNRKNSSSVDGVGTYGLGMINSTGKIGYFTVRMSNAKIDGSPSRLFYTKSNTFTASDEVWLYRGDGGYIQGWASADNVLKSGKIFSADLAVTPILAGTETMNGPVTEDTKVDGSLTMNFAFGI